LSASDEELLERHGRWYIAGRNPRWLRRNALVALGNVGDAADPAVVDAIRCALTSADSMVRAHAVWAAGRLGLEDELATVRHDSAPEVVAELEALATEFAAPTASGATAASERHAHASAGTPTRRRRVDGLVRERRPP
jgi:epoxyqueuosine reductase